MRRLASFRRLSRWERQVFLRALVLLPIAGLGLRVLGMRRVQTLLSAIPRAADASARGDELSHMRQVARLVAAASRHGPYRASCLPMSLTLQRLLRERGIESDLRLGVRKVSGRFEAHAWVERHGEPIAETVEVRERFAAFEQPIAPRKGDSP
jgi:transglutaminase superfamily protein